MARLLGQAGAGEILSDDRVIVRRTEGTIRIYGTPWHGEAGLASPASAPLKKVCFLRHGSRNHMSELRPAEAVTRFLACGFLPFHDGAAVASTLGFLEQVCAAVHCYESSFAPTQGVVKFLAD